MRHLFLIALMIPALLLADVEPTAVPVSAVAPIELRLKPSLASSVVLSLPETEVKPLSQDAGVSADGLKWFSIEHEVTLSGFVDKASIDKNLDVDHGAIVWASTEKTEQLTVVDNPQYAKLLEVDRMGKVEVKEPRVLYYGVSDVSQASAPVAVPVAVVVEPAAVPAVSVETNQPTQAVPAVNHGGLRTIEGVLKKGNPLLGSKLYIEDVNGNYIAAIDPKSPIDRMTIERYLGKTAQFSCEVHEKGSDLTISVRSIRLR